jgi:hypothetical protein
MRWLQCFNDERGKERETDLRVNRSKKWRNNRMYDTGKIITDYYFLCLITFPLWYDAITGKAPLKPD